MSDHDSARQKPLPAGKSWVSRGGVVLVAFLAVAGLLLAYEHRVHIFTGYGILIGLLALCVGMHVIMHGGDGGGHSHGGSSKDQVD